MTAERIVFCELGDMKGRRWTPMRKDEVLERIRRGFMTEREAVELFALAEGEIEAWRKVAEKGGRLGLRATRLQRYR